jgi:hypothetical protein
VPSGRLGPLSQRSRALGGLAAAGVLIGSVVAIGAVATESGHGSVSVTPTPWASVPVSASASAAVATSPSPTPSATTTADLASLVPMAVVTTYSDGRESLYSSQVSTSLALGDIAIPCEATGLHLDGTALILSPTAACLPASRIATSVAAGTVDLALLPPGLVGPTVKVLRIGEADLFGSPTHRARSYPLLAAGTFPSAWSAYEANEVRTLISTGDTCPDRGVSHQAITLGKGWDWTLSGGTATYRGSHWTDHNFRVPDAYRNDDSGKVAALISDNDLSVNDFECPMVASFTVHETGNNFSVDPRVAQLLAGKAGLTVATLNSNHITNAGERGIAATIDYLDAAGIKHVGAGSTPAEALAPAYVDVRGVKFAFVGFGDVGRGKGVREDKAGVALLNSANACPTIKAARAAADVVIVTPQWGYPEYRSEISQAQIEQRSMFYDCGADGILGSGTHWASWVSILPGTNGPLWAIGSHGNFLFDQSWSRQTMEGVIVEATFSGKKLVQFRLHPYVIAQGAQPNLINSTDGAYVLDQVWSKSEVK